MLRAKFDCIGCCRRKWVVGSIRKLRLHRGRCHRAARNRRRIASRHRPKPALARESADPRAQSPPWLAACAAVGYDPAEVANRLPAIEKDTLIEAYKRDVDVTLLEENLKLSPDQRLRQLIALQTAYRELRDAGQRLRDRTPGR